MSFAKSTKCHFFQIAPFHFQRFPSEIPQGEKAPFCQKCTFFSSVGDFGQSKKSSGRNLKKPLFDPNVAFLRNPTSGDLKSPFLKINNAPFFKNWVFQKRGGGTHFIFVLLLAPRHSNLQSSPKKKALWRNRAGGETPTR